MIAYTKEINAAASKADAIYFGSLAQRSKVSRETIRVVFKDASGLSGFLFL